MVKVKTCLKLHQHTCRIRKKNMKHDAFAVLSLPVKLPVKIPLHEATKQLVTQAKSFKSSLTTASP